MWRVALFVFVSTLLTAPKSFGITIWDEDVDGELSGQANAPTSVGLVSRPNNWIRGTVGGSMATAAFRDVIHFDVNPPNVVTGLFVRDYRPAGGNETSGLELYEGANGESGTSVGSATLGQGTIGQNLLPLGGDTLLDESDYSLSIRESTPGQAYAIDLHTALVIVNENTGDPDLSNQVGAPTPVSLGHDRDAVRGTVGGMGDNVDAFTHDMSRDQVLQEIRLVELVPTSSEVQLQFLLYDGDSAGSDNLVSNQFLTTADVGRNLLESIPAEDFPETAFTIGVGSNTPGQVWAIEVVEPFVRNDTVGLHDPANGAFFLRNAHANGPADETFFFGPANAGVVPVAGDWGIVPAANHFVGIYDPLNGAFFLRADHANGPADRTYFFGPANAGWKPIVGDWDSLPPSLTGVGADESAGLYDPAAGAFFLRNAHVNGPADETFFFGPAGNGWIPLTGDWDGDHEETVGLYDPAAGAFFLRNTHVNGPAHETFFFGPAGSGWTPVAGDWDGDGIDTVGLHDPLNGAFFLRNAHANGPADETFFFGPPNAGWVPIAGDWDRD